MEEVESKLKSNNPVVVSGIISGLIKNIRTKFHKNQNDLAELRFLKDKCVSFDPLISDVACNAVYLLVEDNILTLESLLAELITAIPRARCYSSLASLFTKLLILQYQKNEEKSNEDKQVTSLYNLYDPLHPFVRMLNENPSAHRYVYNELVEFDGNNTKEDPSSVKKIFLPVLLYSICNPTSNVIPILKYKLWMFLVGSEYSDSMELIFKVIRWIQLDNDTNVEMNSELIDELYMGPSIKNEALEIILLWQCSFLHNLASRRYDIRPTLHNISYFILEDMSNYPTNFIDTLILILAKTIRICSPTYLAELLTLCANILKFKENEKFSLQVLKSALFPLITVPSILTNDAEKIAKYLWEHIDTYEQNCNTKNTLEVFENYKSLISCNSDVYIATKFNITLDKKKEQLCQWLDDINCAPIFFLRQIFYYLAGIMLDENTPPEAAQKTLELMLKCLQQEKQLASDILNVMLFKLSNTHDRCLVYNLMKQLPSMVTLKENTPKVMASIQAISQNSFELKNFAIKLMVDAWKIENRCYPYLENIVLNEIDHKIAHWETNVTRAFALKELCEHRPELHGKDLVVHLSKVLNHCTDSNGIACAMAIEGIAALCRAEVIDVVTTWANLAPRFKEDTRIPIIKSLCSLISEIPQLPYIEAYNEFVNEVICTLWKYVTTNHNKEVISAALNALISFKLEDICPTVPEEFLDQKTLEEKSTKPSDYMLVLPGATWLNFLSKCSSKEAASAFLIKMVSLEIDNYHKYIYQIKGTKEPVDYSGLPSHSLVRELGTFIKRKHNKWKDYDTKEVYIESLKILSIEYSKPLPPFDWCFLQVLVHEPELKEYCIKIACHQVILSGSARRLIENYLLAVAELPKENDITYIYNSLKHIANSIQPGALQPFLEASIQYVTHDGTIAKDELLTTMIVNLKIVLTDKNIQDINKIRIAQVLHDFMWKVPTNSNVFNRLLECLILIPKKSIDEITTLHDTLSTEMLAKITQVRFALAKTSAFMPLNWVNEVIRIRSKTNSEFYKLDDLFEVFKSQVNIQDSSIWLLEVFGHIQAKVTDRCEKNEITYYCDILMTSVVVFSGLFIFIDENETTLDQVKELFVVALAILLKVEQWSNCTIQVMEWLYHMNFEEVIPTEYKEIFKLALCNLRDNDEFDKNLRWMKYLNCDILR